MHSFEVEVSGLTHDGRGVAHVDGKTLFVVGALPGERARVQLKSRHKKFDEAVVEELLSHSPDRVEPKCAHFGTCSGCALQHLSAPAQIAAKQRVLKDNFERIGKVEPANWLAPLDDALWGYRRKGRLSVKWVEKKGKTLVGFREHDARFVADLASCHTLLPAVGERIHLLSELINGLIAKREIAQIEIAAGDDGVALVFRNLVALQDSDRDALIDFGKQHDLAILLQPKGPDTVHLLWPETLDLRFAIPASNIELAFEPLDFVQVNAGMNQRMVARTLELLDLQPQDRVLDLFCGLGNFTLPMARQAGQVIGVEGDAGLIRRADANAARNGISNASFVVADLFLNHANAAWAQVAHDKLLLDPPRSGAAELLEYLPRKGTDRLVYVSCHPASLARDAGTLVHKHGFTLVSAGVMDMFPHTAHVESIALFQR